ncbi:MAG: M67 family metallopeptidase [Chloroflexi bacterium]|nr:M67 family metallopeptidase [Chloroflexota bacterium]MCL5075873.1 M67 family metallopeptidase [Chloroflexota bacterium]
MFHLEKHYAEEMIRHAWDEYPNEACGILAGRASQVLRLYRAANAAHSQVRYTMEPQEQLRLMQEIDDQEWEILAIYHSHPASAAYPSATDVELAFYPDSLYLIISLQHPEWPEVRGFRIVDGHIEEEQLVVLTTEE